MDLPDSLRNLLGNGSSTPADPEERATRLDGGEIVSQGAEQIAIEVPEDSDVDPDQIEAALSGKAGSVNVQGQAGGDTTVTPVASGSDIHITDSAFDLSHWEYKAFLDDQIVNLMENRVDYNQETGKWILANDDLIPGILIRLKSLMLGKDGLEVAPEDPESDQDQRLADHMEAIYDGDPNVETHVDPGKVVDRVLEQNVMNAVFVGRSTDLQHLDIDDLSYVKDGETGEEIYIQDPTSYTTFEVNDEGEPTVEYGYKSDSTALEIGKEVVDVRLYRTPPLQAVADDVVNKMQLKRLQGRKAEIASIGGVIIKVNPPAWLSEEDYDQYVAESDDEFGGSSGRLLELVMAQQIDAALDTLEDYQSATVMSIPENWETDTIELPEMDESMSSMIRDYNEAISRRLLLPLDLIELKEGPELSRDSMMSMFLDQISGWQGQVTDMFDQFAMIQAEIHGLSGNVEHKLPPIEAQDEAEILKLFNFAGLLGLSEAEGRELANTLEGVDLNTDQMQDLPEDGGPEDPTEREQQMQEMMEQSPENGQNQGSEAGDEGDEPQGEPPEDGMEAAAAPDDGIRFGNVGGDQFADSDMLEVFVQALMDAGADQVWIGNEQWGDHSGIHDRPIIVSGMDMNTAETVWDIFQNDAVALMGPKQMEASASEPSRQEVLASLGIEDQDQIEAEGYPMDPEHWPPRAARAAWRNVGESMDTCMAHMVTEAGWDDRKAQAFCGGLQESLHEQNPLAQFEASQIEDLEADLSDDGAITADREGDPICWVCGSEATHVNQKPPHAYACGNHSFDIDQVPIEEADISAEKHWKEGEEVESPDGQGVVVEVRSEDFDGPDGAVEASEDNPAYIVGVEDGVRVYRGSELSDGEIDADVDSPEADLAAAKAELASDPEAAPNWLLSARGDGRFDYPDSWEESDTPARLILLKAWAGMNGQFDCPSGDCCHGTMVKNGMSDGAADRFCASMKDRVMGGWEGWRKGAASEATVEAEHAFSGFETMREAGAHVRERIEKQTPEGHTTEMRKLDDDRFSILVRDREGNFQGSMILREAETEDDQWVIVGGEDYALLASEADEEGA
jgi:hypothetical protein